MIVHSTSYDRGKKRSQVFYRVMHKISDETAEPIINKATPSLSF